MDISKDLENDTELLYVGCVHGDVLPNHSASTLYISTILSKSLLIILGMTYGCRGFWYNLVFGDFTELKVCFDTLLAIFWL